MFPSLNCAIYGLKSFCVTQYFFSSQMLPAMNQTVQLIFMSKLSFHISKIVSAAKFETILYSYFYHW